MNTTTLSITAAAAQIADGALTPTQLVEAHLARIAALDPQLKSYITVSADVARKQAGALTQELADGRRRGPLHGIPLAYKDCFETAGVVTTAGSGGLREYRPSLNSHAVQLLENAGAILLGKLNMHEWALSVTTNNPWFGACANPHDPARIPGGSSGGSGAAVAAGLAMGSLGTDAGGSVRLPAALCGVVGLKPTAGRITRRGVLPLSFMLDHVGILTRTVADAALLLATVAGYDEVDNCSLDMPVAPYRQEMQGNIRGWRIAVAYEGFDRQMRKADTEVLNALEATVKILEAAGATVQSAPFERMWDANRAAYEIILTDAAAYHASILQDQPEQFSAEALASLRRGQAIMGTVYSQALQTQALFGRFLEEFFKQWDLLLTPACPVPAPLRDEDEIAGKMRMPLLSYLTPFNLTGQPAISVPCGRTASGLPIGAQLVGARWQEGKVLRAARVIEEAFQF